MCHQNAISHTYTIPSDVTSQFKLHVERGYSIRMWNFIRSHLLIWGAKDSAYAEVHLRALRLSVTDELWEKIGQLFTEKCGDEKKIIGISNRLSSAEACAVESRSTNGASAAIPSQIPHFLLASNEHVIAQIQKETPLTVVFSVPNSKNLSISKQM
eukprot:434443_1